MGMNYRAEEATVTRIVEVAGLDLEQLRRDMKELQIETLIETSERFSQALGFNGTPSFVTGDAHVPDFVDVEDLRALVANVRDENE
ncbi:DSBA-like thioredoxin domain-containing protein [Ruegeria marina]|uniref:DSBA-like thioredoxin domain-containing protein n=2 Tax=Ruegeria marina TaxID=639004 RepID=A0A1G6YCP4_9RHOB|nr:DSBA-like thioredoxin domain-containing protein [Ruegeria marina]